MEQHADLIIDPGVKKAPVRHSISVAVRRCPPFDQLDRPNASVKGCEQCPSSEGNLLRQNVWYLDRLIGKRDTQR